MNFKPNCAATAIGSVPYLESEEACRIVLENFTDIPFWPQLPMRSFKENMYVQYSENMPAIVIDEIKERVFFDTSGDLVGKIEYFYQKYLEADLDYFAVSPDFAAGLHRLIELLAAIDVEKPKFIKGHVTGPISFGLSVTDEHKRPVLYNELLIDPIVKTIGRKAAWQEALFKSVLPQASTIIFIDEPYLTSFGSAFISLKREDAIRYLKEVIQSISGSAGVHCCGNTDWTLFTEAGADIISFDAYDYTESLSLYPAEIDQFLIEGGVLAWGIVPTRPGQIEQEDIQTLWKRWKSNVEILTKKGIDHDLLLQACLITPNCGTGSLSIDAAEKVFRLTKTISDLLKERSQ